MYKMDSEDTDGELVSGTVKWFDPTKGFGFVVAESGGPDILLHANVLRNFGQSSVADSAGIEVIVQRTARGIQAIEVLKIEPPAGEAGEMAMADDSAEIGEPVDLSLPLEPARVKWFDKSKGFGASNRGRYSNPEVDKRVVEALRTVDDAKRETGRQAT